MDSRIFRERLEESKSNGLRSFFIPLEKLLERICLKWARITLLDIWNTSLCQKKGRESNWQFDSRPLKVGNRPNFLVCRWCATYHWKDLDEEYNFASNLVSIEGLHAKLWAPKVAGLPFVGILGFSLGSPRTKWHLGASPVARHIAYYKGEGGGFPQVCVMVNLVSSSLPVACPNIKSVPTMH